MAVNAAVLVALLACGLLTFGQQAAEQKGNPRGGGEGSAKGKPAQQGTAELLAEALKNNPDIKVAEAKLQEAAAILERARLLVTQKIVTHQQALRSQKEQVTAAEDNLKRMITLRDKGAIPMSLVETARTSLVLAKAKLAELEAELPYLLGRQPATKDNPRAENQRLRYLLAITQAQAAWERHAVEQGVRWLAREVGKGAGVRASMADKIRKALDTPVNVNFDATPLRDALEYFENRVGGVSFRIISGEANLKDQPLDLSLKEKVSLGAAIQGIQDSLPDIRFAVRDYGVLVTSKERLPPDAVLLLDFWKAGKGERKTTASKNDSRALDRDVKGMVVRVDAKTNLAQINIGSDAGLAKGQTLEVFRVKPQPVYVGTIVIVEVMATQAVGKPTLVKMQVQVGDQVASRIVNK
jgi:hypothetical protein